MCQLATPRLVDSWTRVVEDTPLVTIRFIGHKIYIPSGLRQNHHDNISARQSNRRRGNWTFYIRWVYNYTQIMSGWHFSLWWIFEVVVWSRDGTCVVYPPVDIKRHVASSQWYALNWFIPGSYWFITTWINHSKIHLFGTRPVQQLKSRYTFMTSDSDSNYPMKYEYP